jgi:hypothetical protein
MQVFDLTQLRNVVNPPVTFSVTAHYNQFSRAHNIAINEESGFAYARTGTTYMQRRFAYDQYPNARPAPPLPAVSADGYTHDTQCVIYSGRMSTIRGRKSALIPTKIRSQL